MHWAQAVLIAQHQGDVTYEEWCGLYVHSTTPTEEQVRAALPVAKTILVRNGKMREEDELTFRLEELHR